MKILIIIFTLSLSAVAQDNNYTGPARFEVKIFWGQMDKVKKTNGGASEIKNAEKALADAKQKDPSLITNSMEEELNKWKNGIEKSSNENTTTSSSNSKSPEMIKLRSDITDYLDLPGYSTPVLEKAQKQLDDFKLNVQSIVDRKELLQEYKKTDRYNALISRLKGYSDVSLNRSINDIVIACENSDGVKGSNWENAYYDMRGLKVKWLATNQAFPDIKEFADAVKKCEELCNKYPTLEKIEAIGKSNKTAAIKARKLPQPIIKDSKLEQILMDGFDKKYGPAYRSKAVKAVLTQDGWTTEKNAITGIVTGRNRTGKIAYKTTEGDGKCYLLSNNIFIYEEYIGGSFTNTQVIYNGLGGDEMLCENVK